MRKYQKSIRAFSIYSLVGVLLFSCKPRPTQESVKLETTGKPNIIFIYADDWGYEDLGSHGSTFCKTPNLDKMVKEGVDFQNFTVSNPVCSPSRTAVMTGHFPARHSVHGHFATVQSHIKRNMPDWLNPEVVMLPRLLKEAGYKTAHYGKWHLSNTHVADAPSPLDYGYDAYDAFNLPNQLPQMSADSTMTRTLDFIEKNKENPFFVNVWVHATHTPHYPKEKFLAQFSDLDEQQQVYAAVVAEADYNIGLLFNKLKELGLDENTLVIFSSDNGPEITGNEYKKHAEDNSTGPGLGTYYSVGETNGLKGRKRSLYAGGIRVPFIVRWPGVVPAGKVDKTTPLAAVDILPTFVELAGGTLPETYEPDGESLVSIFKGNSYTRQSTIYWQWLFANVNTDFWPGLGIQDGEWKLLINREINRKELYNTNTDWAEQIDLVAQNPGKVKELEAKLDKWLLTLPENPPTNCFSAERGSLTNN
ncbi:sulfatase-like hydrolase/transferase [Fulvivirga sp. M361]|uniref:sulfatase-like hydrolase/transferase n=1 Tax=Fulvivirga sp. M361 TaxID=2594266 RepID=UPI001179BAE0|nr:sulfatase-like hydrolase/transferase [Fulvivirga sp. M361]TRX59213.1 sulfatase-like hydrolase/transferase [Fulvivirga sp. M361]